AVLRLQLRRLLEPLAGHGPALRKAAADLPRQLVPPGRRRQLHVAGLRRKPARAALDPRPLREQGGGAGNGHRLPTDEGCAGHLRSRHRRRHAGNAAVDRQRGMEDGSRRRARVLRKLRRPPAGEAARTPRPGRPRPRLIADCCNKKTALRGGFFVARWIQEAFRCSTFVPLLERSRSSTRSPPSQVTERCLRETSSGARDSTMPHWLERPSTVSPTRSTCVSPCSRTSAMPL